MLKSLVVYSGTSKSIEPRLGHRGSAEPNVRDLCLSKLSPNLSVLGFVLFETALTDEQTTEMLLSGPEREFCLL